MMPSWSAVVALLVAASAAPGDSTKVLLISMDGFRWDYINTVPDLTNFKRLAEAGCSVDYVNNPFITKTFPSHYTIVTGLYEESHGIVANSMYDPERKASFRMGGPDFWWSQGEPIWITAEKQKRNSSAVYFWPGSEAEVQGLRPSIYRKYNGSVPFLERVDTVIKWIVDDKKDFVALYFHEPDSTGHTYGPGSPQVATVVRQMDVLLGVILDKLESNKLAETVNIILTSDHGMAEISMDTRLIDLWAYVNRSDVEIVPDSETVTAILPKAGMETKVFEDAARIPNAKAYKKEDLPDHFHYKHNSRIMPIIVISNEGWTVSTNVSASRASNGRGAHGYSNELMSMKPIFFAKGPAFKKGERLTSIQAVDIYPLMCKLLGLVPSPNNGSLSNTAQFLVQVPQCLTGQASALTWSTGLSLLLCVIWIGTIV